MEDFVKIFAKIFQDLEKSRQDLFANFLTACRTGGLEGQRAMRDKRD